MKHIINFVVVEIKKLEEREKGGWIYYLNRAKHIIFQSTHLKDLFHEEIKESGAAEVFFIDEFFDWNYFHKDMPHFLERIKDHVAQME